MLRFGVNDMNICFESLQGKGQFLTGSYERTASNVSLNTDRPAVEFFQVTKAQCVS
jgi:hypothetical protein